MPTIDELAPATSASDGDALLVSQSGTTKKITRAQVIAGLQPQLAVPSGTLLGRASTGTGPVEAVALGSNLSLNAGTLSAIGGSTLSLLQLPAGSVQSGTDLVAVTQGATTVSVSYSQFISSIPLVAGSVDLSQAMVTPAGTTAAKTLAALTGNMVSSAGGTLSGPLLLAGPPTTGVQAATKNYADLIGASALPKSGGTLSGPLTLAGDPTLPVHAANKNYVDVQILTTVPKAGGTLAGPLTLNADPTTALQAATKQYADTKVSRSGDTLSGPLTLAGPPTASLHAAPKSYVDTLVQGALPAAGGTLTGSLFLSGDPTWSIQAATKNYVDLQAAAALPRSGGTSTGPIVLSGDPSVSLGAATKQYVDARVAKTGDTLVGPLTLAADPALPLHASTKNYVDSQIYGALPKAGGTLTGSLSLGSDPATAMQAATKRYVDAQVAASLPVAGGTLSGALTLSGQPQNATSAANKQYVDTQIATTLPLLGGTLTGNLTLAASPTANNHAANKQYVDASFGLPGIINVKSGPYNATLNGTTDDTAAFAAAYQACAANGIIQVPGGTTSLKAPSAWNVARTKPVKWLIHGTVLPDGTALSSSVPTGGNPASLCLPGVVEGYSASGVEFSKGSSAATDLAVLHSAYIVNHTGGTAGVVANSRSDTIIYNSPNSYTWGGLDRLVWAGVQTPNSASAAQHVGRYIQTIRQSIGTNSSGTALPQPQLWAACLEYRDATGKPSSWSNASLTVEMDWIGNGADDAGTRQIQSLVVAQHDPKGAPVEVSSVVGIYLGGGSTGKAYRVFNVGIPFSTAVLDTTGSQQLAGAAAIRMAAGHSIAFEPTAQKYLAYDTASDTLRWNQGGLSYTVGKGITVGWANVCSSNTTLPNYLAGNIVFLIGSSAFTITLPSAASTPAGTGFTFSVLGSASVAITPAGGDGIDNGPVTLRTSDRYHIVSDGSGTWREIFRTNTVSPRFTGPPVLPSYQVASLPASPGPGAKAFVTNGRKPNEGAGAGTGVEVFFDGIRWICGCTGYQVLA